MKKHFGIIGNPISHSLSPVLHQYWFKKYDIDADYSIIEMTNKDLPRVIKKIREREISGLNVTLPFKQKILNYVDKVVNDAELTGSVNTILFNHNKKVIGENTDVFGLQAAYLKEIENSLSKKVLIEFPQNSWLPARHVIEGDQLTELKTVLSNCDQEW